MPENPLIQILVNLANKHGLTKEHMLEVITEGYQAQLEVLNKDIAHTRGIHEKEVTQLQGLRAEIENASDKSARKDAKQAFKDTERLVEAHHNRITEDVANSAYLVAAPLIQMKQAGLPLILHKEPHEDAKLKQSIEAGKRDLFGEKGVTHPEGADNHPVPNMTILRQMTPKDILESLSRMSGDMPTQSAPLESLGVEATNVPPAKGGKGAHGLN